MKIACIQFAILWEAPEANFERVKVLIKEAKQNGAELICLPELFSTGVTRNSDKFAEQEDGKTGKFLSEQAKKNDTYLLGSFIEKSKEKKSLPKNAVIVFNPKGKLVCKYQKNHVFTYGNEDKAYSNGKGISCFKMNAFVFYPFICYDLRFPELFRIAIERANEANVFIIPANWPNPRKDHWVTLLRARAIENQAYVIGINRCGNSPELSFFGSSMIVSPKGEIIAQSGEAEETILADLRPEEVNEWRTTFSVLKDKRTKYYSVLASEK
ncbi:MAG: carbon-nitrogen family hydrolase [Planctomycetes bacterium]|nr:carbon-nitrogen family hydrolase [Planctomycetota bacterium]